MDNISITSLMSAFGRAYHTSHENEPIFRDDFARRLMSDIEYEQTGRYILNGIDFLAPELKGTFADDDEALLWLVNTQIAPTPLARSRYCEDCLKTAALTGTGQYVVLGAGLDTFAFREPGFLKKHHVFEVDHPEIQADKIERIKRAGLEIPDNLTFVPVDFSKDSLTEALANSGYKKSGKTFFSWLGVSYYLTTEEIDRLLSELSQIGGEGSSLVFDFADNNLFNSPVNRVQNMLAMAAAGGEPMKSCFSYTEIEKLLEKEQSPIKRVRYEGMKEALLYILEKENELS